MKQPNQKHFCFEKAVYRVPKKLWHLLDLVANVETGLHGEFDREVLSTAIELQNKSKFLFKIDAIIT